MEIKIIIILKIFSVEKNLYFLKDNNNKMKKNSYIKQGGDIISNFKEMMMTKLKKK